MRVPEPIETPGFFWLPEKPENRVPGTLHISDSGEVGLEATGLFRDHRAIMEDYGMEVEGPVEYERPNLNRIVGIVENGGLVTLDGCIPQREQFGTGLSKSFFHASLAFIGSNYGAEDEVTFSKFVFSCDGLDDWLSISGFCLEIDPENKRYSIHYHYPGKIPLTLLSGIELNFDFDFSFPTVSFPTTETSVSQKARVIMISNEPQTLGYFLSLISKICSFLSLATDQNVSIDSMTGYPEKEVGNSEMRQVSVGVYGKIGHHSEKKPSTSWHEMLFTYANVGGQLEQALARWLESYDRFGNAFNLYFASRSDAYQNLDVKFLQLVQGIEVLHRRSSKEKLMPEDEFRKFKADIVSDIQDDDKRSWLKEKLAYANELSLRERVERIVEPFACLLGDEDECRAFAGKVASTRNYLTHFSKGNEKRAASGEELWYLHRKLEALFQMHLMRRIGFDDKSIEFMARENDVLRAKLGLPRSAPLLPSRSPQSVLLSLQSGGRPAGGGSGSGRDAGGATGTAASST